MKHLFKALLMYSAAGAWIGRLPFIQRLYVTRVWRKRMHAFYGVFGSYGEVERFSASLNHVGWHDDTVMSEMLVAEPDIDTSVDFQTSQYAVLLWLAKLRHPGMTVLDFGGAGGIFYEICGHYGLLERSMHWHVVDMPDTIERGRKRQAARGSETISFGSDVAAAPAAEIMLMLGVLQYLPDPFGERGPGLLETLQALPEHILINKVPLTDAPDWWSAQNHVSSIMPCRFFNRTKFLAYFERHGYRLRDRWSVPELAAEIPFHPERTLVSYDGVYLTRLHDQDR